MKDTIKIVVFGLIFFAGLVYLTAPEPPVKKEDLHEVLSTKNFKEKILLANESEISKKDLFKENEKSLIIIGNHDSLSVVSLFDSLYDVSIPVVIVANVSAAPWFIKEWVLPEKLLALKELSSSKMVYDKDGEFVKALNLRSAHKQEFIVYTVDKTGLIKRVYRGFVKEDAIDGSMNKKEIKEVLLPILKYIK